MASISATQPYKLAHGELKEMDEDLFPFERREGVTWGKFK